MALDEVRNFRRECTERLPDFTLAVLPNRLQVNSFRVRRELFRSDRVRIYEITTIRPRIGNVITATSRPP
jgi:hypothetical protein